MRTVFRSFYGRKQTSIIRISLPDDPRRCACCSAAAKTGSETTESYEEDRRQGTFLTSSGRLWALFFLVIVFPSYCFKCSASLPSNSQFSPAARASPVRGTIFTFIG